MGYRVKCPKYPTRRPRRNREDNVKRELEEVGCQNWRDVAQDKATRRTSVLARFSLSYSFVASILLTGFNV